MAVIREGCWDPALLLLDCVSDPAPLTDNGHCSLAALLAHTCLSVLVASGVTSAEADTIEGLGGSKLILCCKDGSRVCAGSGLG
mmetsp:Transcript_92092/g.159863  ORF Transcript_92092/g.159863 Transcript_92092/m.159863 type:complete len:84 (+) Transcript_92092:3-254(+)